MVQENHIYKNLEFFEQLKKNLEDDAQRKIRLMWFKFRYKKAKQKVLMKIQQDKEILEELRKGTSRDNPKFK